MHSSDGIIIEVLKDDVDVGPSLLTVLERNPFFIIGYVRLCIFYAKMNMFEEAFSTAKLGGSLCSLACRVFVILQKVFVSLQ